MGFLALSTVLVWALAVWAAAAVLRGRGLMRRLQTLVAAVLLAGLGVLLGTLLGVLRAFDAFSDETLVARVTTSRFSPKAFELTYLPATPGRATEVRLEGDQWSISGGIVKWHPWLTGLGLKTYHVPLRLSGQFARIEEQRAHLPTVHPLRPGPGRLWEWLYRADPYLPFVDAVYGSAAFVYVEPGAVHEVYITPSGYLIKRTRPSNPSS